MTHPTKAEVEKVRHHLYVFGGKRIPCQALIRLCDAYLALREEVKGRTETSLWKQRIIDEQESRIITLTSEITELHSERFRLQADNQALRGELEKVCRVLSNIDSMTVIKAKEKAGYGEQVKAN